MGNSEASSRSLQALLDIGLRSIKKVDRNGEITDDASDLSVTPVDSLLFEARLNPFSAPLLATQNRVDERVLNFGEIDFMSEVEVVVDSRSGPGMGSRGVEESLADEE